MKASVTTQQISLKETKQAIETLQSQIQHLANRYNAYTVKTHLLNEFNGLTATATLAIMHHEEMAQSITKLLTNVLHGKITDIIPAKQLEHTLREISVKLQPNTELPVNLNTESIYHIFKTSSIHSTLLNGRVLVEVKIPIILREPFRVIKAIPIPIEQNSTYALIQPTDELFITNTDSNVYIPFSDKALERCIPTSNKYICLDTLPVVRKPHDICELELINHINLNAILRHKTNSKEELYN